MDRQPPGTATYRGTQSIAGKAVSPELPGKDSGLIDVVVVDRQHTPIGKVEDVAIHDRLAYLVLSLDGMPDMRGTLYAVPWKLMRHDREHQTFVLNLSHDEIERLPVFANGCWPGMKDELAQQAVVGDAGDIKPF